MEDSSMAIDDPVTTSQPSEQSAASDAPAAATVPDADSASNTALADTLTVPEGEY